METKKPVEKKETKTVSKSEKAINLLLKNRGFDKHQIISENTKELTVAFGYEKHNHSELIIHNFSKKTNETVIVDGEASFDEFVIKVKEYLKKD